MYENFFDNCRVTLVEDDEHWHELRGKGIGGSDAAIIINESSYKTPYQLWREKTGMVNQKFITNAAIEKGNRLEQPLIDTFAALYPEYSLIDTKSISLESLKFPFMRANLDGALIGPDNKKGILEIKTTTIHRESTLKDNWTYYDREDRKEIIQIPKNYYCQCLHYLEVTDFDFCIIFALLDFPGRGNDGLRRQETRVELILKENVVIDTAYIVKKEKEFWRKVQEKEPPVFLNKKITI